jgi:hypothetical protein
MDKIIANYFTERKNGLCYCPWDGVAYQPDMTHRVEYDQAYFEKYVMYETTPIGEMLNARRLEVVKSWAKKMPIIDIGVGCGTFCKYALGGDLDISGFDINPVAVHWLTKHGINANPYATPEKFKCWTFWDSLEHIPNPHVLLEKITLGSYVFISMPIFDDLEDIVNSKHYRPNEHFYYFTAAGLFLWMRSHKFQLQRIYNFEEAIGRENIKTFLFERVALVDKKIDMLRNYYQEMKYVKP